MIDLTMSDGQSTEFVPKQDIRTFYKGSTVFLTGVTGFLGHVLLSKLLWWVEFSYVIYKAVIKTYDDLYYIVLCLCTFFFLHCYVFHDSSSCPDIRKIYILIREKKGKDIRTRFQDIFDQPVSVWEFSMLLWIICSKRVIPFFPISSNSFA